MNPLFLKMMSATSMLAVIISSCILLATPTIGEGLRGNAENRVDVGSRKLLTACSTNKDCGKGKVCVQDYCVTDGYPRFTLYWEGNDDLDLLVKSPSGDVLYWNDDLDEATGGRYENDSHSSKIPVENIYFPGDTGGLPGEYLIRISDKYDPDDPVDTWTLEVWDLGRLLARRTGVGRSPLYKYDRRCVNLIEGTDEDDHLVATDGDCHNIIKGHGGDDTIQGGEWMDLLVGGRGNDSIVGGNGNDLIIGGDGHDTINAGIGNDIVDAGLGFDSIQAGEGNDLIMGGGGDDTIAGGDGYDKLIGGSGSDNIKGGDKGDTISGGNGDDTIDGVEGDDLIFGDAGSDRITGGAGKDTIIAGTGSDEVIGGDDNDFIFAGTGEDILSGSAGDDFINAGLGNDIILGGEGDDLLIGGPGSDTLGGGIDNLDTVIGGLGQDDELDDGNKAETDNNIFFH